MREYQSFMFIKNNCLAFKLFKKNMCLISNKNPILDQLIIANGFYEGPFSNVILRNKTRKGGNIVNESLDNVCFLFNSKLSLFFPIDKSQNSFQYQQTNTTRHFVTLLQYQSFTFFTNKCLVFKVLKKEEKCI